MKEAEFSTGKVFGQAAKAAGFHGTGVTRFIELTHLWLVINHQKSSYSKLFYVNVGIFYKELLTEGFRESEIKMEFKKGASAWPHVDFRMEGCPSVRGDFQAEVDKCVAERDVQGLEEVLSRAFSRLMEFVEKSGDRKSIRRLVNEKKLAAMVLKEV
ncbi:MAG: hypothetical protein GAK33_06154 [Burkholderia lata]|uniref:DUF4304 domain-containing protein n=1 Tax=Burkholderia lata (strain ATCC 17760 / DSM 23089 / LMG 22485 / NCIMB 9086 / R18194 / 383) TaxID=482957 RepID=A0A833PJC9_BURL3|nr:DUF4304 domain-containing protein [Burkholderia lata]KAF1033809.1 MAG: hypothetical protein GAK33_06154 [Burkholderia lata]